MPTLFDDVLIEVEGIVDEIFAEGDEFAFIPMRQVVSDEPVPDNTRPANPLVVGVFSDSVREFDAGGAMKIVSAQPTLSLMMGQVGNDVRQGDQFTRIKTGITYEVEDIKPEGLGRMLLEFKER